MAQNVAIVTGSNKGIGYSIVEGLCKRFDGVVYLTSRDEKRGKSAVADLNKLGLKPEFHILDVSNKKTVEEFSAFIKSKHGGVDILVNNAAILDLHNHYPSYEDVKQLIDTNYYGLLNIDEAFRPLLRPNGRVVNISSDCGHLANIRNKHWLKVLSNKDLTLKELNEFVEWFLESIKTGSLKKEDFANEAIHAEYRVSKVAMSAFTVIVQREVASRNISVNSIHPGFVQTQMTQQLGFYTQEQGASGPLYLALDAPDSLQGAYVWHDKSIVDWYDYEGDYYCTWLSATG